MKKNIIITAIAITILFVLLQSGVLNALLMFLLIGAVPGTPYIIPPNAMLALVLSVIWLVLFRLMFADFFTRHTPKKSSKRRITGRKKRPSAELVNET